MVEMKITTIVIGGDGKGNNYLHIRLGMPKFVYIDMLKQALAHVDDFDYCGEAGCRETHIGRS